MNRRWQIWLIGGAAVGVVILVIANRSNQPVYSLDDDNPAFRAAAVRQMSGKTDTHLLIRALDDNDTDVRLLAIERLSASGQTGAEALVRLLNDDHAGIRREAAWSLGLIGADAWPPLKEALQDRSPRVRAAAALALSSAYRHKDDKPWPSRIRDDIVPILRGFLTDENSEVRQNAKEALHDIDR
jgi:HEAT repeat protein